MRALEYIFLSRQTFFLNSINYAEISKQSLISIYIYLMYLPLYFIQSSESQFPYTCGALYPRLAHEMWLLVELGEPGLINICAITVLLSVISGGCSRNDSFEEFSGGHTGSAFARVAVALRGLAKQPASLTETLLAWRGKLSKISKGCLVYGRKAWLLTRRDINFVRYAHP